MPSPFDTVSSVFKSKSSSKSETRFTLLDYRNREEASEETYRSFDGKRRGHKHHHHR